nr:cytochrome c [Pseudenhygromyxa sp. WMMC2535]
MKRISTLLLPLASALLLTLTTAACDKGGDTKADDKKEDADKAGDVEAPPEAPPEAPAAETTGDTTGGDTTGDTTGGDTTEGDTTDGEDTEVAAAAAAPEKTSDSKGKTGTEKDEPKPAAAPAGPKADGKEVYMKKCKSCHAANGNGDTTIGKKVDIPSLQGSKMSKGKIIKVIEDGVDGTKMKAFKTKLSADEIEAVAIFVTKL